MFRTDLAVWLPTGYLNASNDPEPGALVADPVSPRWRGILGKAFAVEKDEALARSLTTTGTLRGGCYQYVKAVTALARGQIVTWSDFANFVVTSTNTAPLEGRIAGIALNTVAAGNYTFIQTWGLASVLYRATVTSKVDGNVVIQLTTTNTADAIADATGTYVSGGVLGIKNVIGQAAELPVDGGVNLVFLRCMALNV
jgi:hypothetical protein